MTDVIPRCTICMELISGFLAPYSQRIMQKAEILTSFNGLALAGLDRA